MTDSKLDNWHANFYKSSGLFNPILPAFSKLNCNQEQWPGLTEFQTLSNLQIKNISNEQKIPIQFVEQSLQCDRFEDQYEARIYLSGEVQTRLNNWHDFFQVLVWNTFPETKKLLNALHYHAAVQRLKIDENNHQRTKVENFLTLFDECGVIIVSTDQDLLNLIQQFQWQHLFWENRQAFDKNIACFTFGHAMYEKALNPYIGMTANALLIHIEDTFFDLEYTEKLMSIDNICKQKIISEKSLSPKSLNPFPILGVPEWYEENNSLEFYLNESYFRKGRKKRN